MPDLELNKEMNVEVKVRLISKGNDEAISGTHFVVKLYDKDVFNDDFLGQCNPDDEGVARFLLSEKDFTKPAGFDEKPDFYFVVFKDNTQVFKSKVMSNLDLSNLAEFTNKEGEIIDLGTFLISTES